jgi:hypothetical protein
MHTHAHMNQLTAWLHAHRASPAFRSLRSFLFSSPSHMHACLHGCTDGRLDAPCAGCPPVCPVSLHPSNHNSMLSTLQPWHCWLDVAVAHQYLQDRSAGGHTVANAICQPSLDGVTASHWVAGSPSASSSHRRKQKLTSCIDNENGRRPRWDAHERAQMLLSHRDGS